MLLLNSKALLSQWKLRDAAVNFYRPTYRNLQRHRAVLPATARLPYFVAQISNMIVINTLGYTVSVIEYILISHLRTKVHCPWSAKGDSYRRRHQLARSRRGP